MTYRNRTDGPRETLLLVEDDPAVRRVLLEGRLLAEPSGATSVACAIAAGLTGPHSVAVVSGGNIDPPVLLQALSS